MVKPWSNFIMAKWQKNKMLKKKKYLIFGGLFLFVLYFSFFLQTSTPKDTKCAFCNEDVLNYQKFYEDDLVLALYTHKPIFPGHCLIIPKRHVQRFEMLSEEETLQMSKVIKEVDQAVSKVFKTTSYLLLQKNGFEVGQTVPHVHFHYIPRKAGDSSLIKFFLKMFLINAGKPIKKNEMNASVTKLKEAIKEI